MKREKGKWVSLLDLDKDGKLRREGISGDDYITIIDTVAHVWRPEKKDKDNDKA